MKFVLEVLRGMVIGLANIIPGVSGGTMMVSMGIYDTLIHCITHLFKEFKKSVMTLLPYAIGMAVAIGALSFALKWAFANYALPTNTLFIGLILGGLPAILRQVKGKKKGPVGAVLFLAFFALIILMQLFQSENSVTIQLSVVEVLKLFVLGAVASATMIIPGVSGSMILKILGYYEPVVTVGIPGLLTGLRYGDWAAVAANLGISIISHSVCREEERRGELVVVPIENCRMLREINLVYPEDFPYPEMLQELRAEYEKRQ